jgi:hypothetical protein
MGVFSHNAEATPKWKANDYLKGIMSYIKGIETNAREEWYLQSIGETANQRKKRKIKALKDSKQPTLFETKINLFYGLLHRVLKIGKATTLKKEALEALWLKNTKTKELICKLPDLFEIDREIDKRNYFEREFNMKYEPLSDVQKTEHHIHNIIKVLMIRNVLTIDIVAPAGMSAESKAMIWPYTLMNEFNDMPAYVKSSVISSSYKSVMKQFLTNNHKHLKQGLACEICLTGKARNVPKYLTSVKELMTDSEEQKEIKRLLRVDIESHTEDAITSVMEDIMIEICRDSRVGTDIMNIWINLRENGDGLSKGITKLIAIKNTRKQTNR